MPSKKTYAETKRPAIEAAAMKVMAHHGYDGATLQMIADEAGVAPSLINKFYGGKRRLAALCLRRFTLARIQDFRDSAPLRTNYREHTAFMLGQFKTYRNEWRLMLSVMMTPALADLCDASMKEYLATTRQVNRAFEGQIPTDKLNDFAYCIAACHVAYALGGDEENCTNAKALLMDCVLE